MSRRPVITGLGFITPIGNDRGSVIASLRAGTHGLSSVQFLGNPSVPVKVAGVIRDFDVASTNYRDWTWPARYEFPREVLRSLAPHGLFALCAVTQALQEAGIANEVANDDGTGLFCASAGSAMLLHHNLAQMHAVGGMRGNPMGVVSSIAGTLNFTLAAYFKITGAVCGFVSACASSGHALGYACDEIWLGRLQRVIVIGAEDDNAETILPFAGMRALSLQTDPALASRPFDVKRDGFVGAGGAVAMVLEAEDVARARDARIQGYVAGWGQSADGHSVSISHPEGTGLRRAMQRAMADAGVTPSQIDYVSAHATSTPVGDSAEAAALRAIFADAGLHPLVSSTKGLTGHPLSLSAVMEAAFCILALEERFVPGNHHLAEADPACSGLDLPRASVDKDLRLVLNNSSGFGGSNVCQIFGQLENP